MGGKFSTAFAADSKVVNYPREREIFTISFSERIVKSLNGRKVAIVKNGKPPLYHSWLYYRFTIPEVTPAAGPWRGA